MDSLKTGTILHGKSYDYKIIQTLGQGTFGITYLASVKMTGALGSIDSEIQVAVKEFFMRDFNGRNECSVTYSSKDGAFAYYKTKFIHEAENLSNLHDSRIIKVIELFEENQTAYYVMEYVSQGSLDKHIISHGQLSSKESVTYAIQIAKALGYMHKNNMLHLDLKPNNIMVKENNDIVLIDFGLSKRFDAYGQPETSTTIGHGTPGYAPIEQANYQGKNGEEFPATMDIYALGATIFKMLTGHRPPEASIILNDGFPFTELRNYGVPESIIDVVAKCMEPLRKNRYKSTEEIISALNAIKAHMEIFGSVVSSKGYYKKKQGEREYGTFHIENVPVTSSIDFPEYINIKLWDNSKKGKSYEIIMTDGHFEDGYYSLMKIWDRGNLILEHEFEAGIPEDVKEFIISHGFLSTEHWENECETTPIADDFGTDASITMVLKEGIRFERRVTHAHPAYHNLLLEELLELLKSTSLAKELYSDKIKLIHPELFVVPDNTFEVSVNYYPAFIGPRQSEDGYCYTINENDLGEDATSISTKKFQSFLGNFKNLGILIGPYKKDDHDYSEEPGKLNIEFKRKDNSTTRLYLLAFNTDMLAGNIYGANINDLAESIKHIFLKYLPKLPDPTRELIHSIPDSTSEIWIDYSEGGLVGIADHTKKLGIINIKRSNCNEKNSIYSPEELSSLVNGLSQLRLRSKDENDVEPPTGKVFPQLTLSLYDSKGSLLKRINAKDNGDDMIGNVVISVDGLKKELAKISKSFMDMVTETDHKHEQYTRESTGGAIFRFLLFSIVIALIALPTYLFVKQEDDCFLWLWITIGITELFSALLFSIGARFNNTSSISNFEAISFIIGIISLVVYVVLWIFQMIYWWA